MASQEEIEQRKIKGFKAIKKAYRTEQGEDSVDLFVDHHLEEIESLFWKKHLGNEKPEGIKVLDILVLRSHWGDEEGGIENFDFTLPEAVTDYVICVSFDEDGEIDYISMES